MLASLAMPENAAPRADFSSEILGKANRPWLKRPGSNSRPTALLAPDEPAPGRSRRLSIADGGFSVPAGLRSRRTAPFRARSLTSASLRRDLKRHIAWDIGIEGVARRLSDGARRAPHHADLFAAGDRLQPPAGQRGIPLSPKATARRSRATENISRVRRCGARATKFSAPYHGTIVRHLDARKAAQSLPTILDFAAQLHAGLWRHRAALAGRRAL